MTPIPLQKREGPVGLIAARLGLLTRPRSREDEMLKSFLASGLMTVVMFVGAADAEGLAEAALRAALLS